MQRIGFDSNAHIHSDITALHLGGMVTTAYSHPKEAFPDCQGCGTGAVYTHSPETGRPD